MFKRTIVIGAVTIFIFIMTAATFAQGRKIGLFVGINEYDGVEISKLKSCVNDAVNMRAKLSLKYGFEVSNTSLLTDRDATRSNILAKLAFYEKEAAAGDTFVFYYSGHGAIYPDALSLFNDETEQISPPTRTQLATGYYDSTIIPVDAYLPSSRRAWGNMILDDELYEIFSRFTARGVQVIFISDSCHAGTLAKSLSDNEMIKFALPKTFGSKANEWNQAVRKRGRKVEQNFNNLFLVIGSSQDDQFSQAGGARDMSLFTKVFIRKLNEFDSVNKTFTYQSILDAVTPEVDLLSKNAQTPRLDARFFDKNLVRKPIFSLVRESAPTGGNRMRIAVKVTDENGVPITNAAFGVFTPDTDLKRAAGKENALLLGRTNQKGLFDSGTDALEPGRYKVKVVKRGYRAFTRDMEVVPAKNNTLVLIFKLVTE